MMNDKNIEGIDILEELIVGRVEPHIYAFTTNTVPNYLKIGDTYRPVATRLKEWSNKYPDLEQKYENKAVLDEQTYFRDYAVHKYLEIDLQKQRLEPDDVDEDVYYSKEFFKNVDVYNIEGAIIDIQKNYKNGTGKYDYYSTENKLPKVKIYKRGENWKLRPNQEEVVNNFVNAVEKGRNNLLMYAVMRFGKSFTSLYCALKIDAKIVLVVSGKGDVEDEWKKTVQSAGNFHEFDFLNSTDLENNNIIKDKLLKNHKLVIFLTLQDLQGDKIKHKHKELLSSKIDLLIVDETHFGARADSYGQIIRNSVDKKAEEKNISNLNDDSIDAGKVSTELKKLDARIKLHLSGTPYRILMGSEFEKEDIISFVQFSDIVNAQKLWDKEYLNNDEVNEWDNPYFGFPQMIRFAFNLNKSSRAKIEALKKEGNSFAFSELFEPKSIKKDIKEGNHKKFKNEKEILDLLQVIDGTKKDDNLLSFLDYNRIKEGKMCQHLVMVLPYCASCDAMEDMLKSNKDKFKNFNEYEIVNISGVDKPNIFKATRDIKNKIREFVVEGKKTITLTVNRMLTGATVEQWDTMLYFKDTSSPQEYDQSIFRLQNQYVRTLSSGEKEIKQNLKPQTLLVDFSPDRLFKMQEQKSLIYNVNTEENGNNKLKSRIDEELKISPVITMNHNKVKEVTATNILEKISEYNKKRSISDEVTDIPIDLNILNDADVKRVIERQSEFNSKQGFTVEPYEGDSEDVDIPEGEDGDKEKSDGGGTKNTNNKAEKDSHIEALEVRRRENQIKTYYQRLLFFSFLTKDAVSSLDDILVVLDKDENRRIANNLYLEKDIVEKISNYMDPFKRSRLDYKIQNISMLAGDETVTPLERALTSLNKINRWSESEIITSSKISDEMIYSIPEKGLRKLVENQEIILDIASKSGEFAVSLYKRLTSDLNFTHNDIREIIYSIPTSSVAYEFTRRFYEILDLNIDNIAVKFNSYDLLTVEDDKKEIDCSKISELLKQDKKICNITIKDEIRLGANKLKFGAVVGNPPYQISDNDSGKGSAKPIYDKFSMIAMGLEPDYVTMIVPSVWFTGGKGLDDFRDYMLNIKGLKKIKNFITSQDVFPQVNLRGGVNYYLFDKNYNNDNGIQIINVKEEKVVSDQTRPKKIEGVDIFIADNIAYNIINRMISEGHISVDKESDKMLSKYISSRKPFGFDTRFTSADLFKSVSDSMEKPIKVYASKGNIGYVEYEEIIKNKEWVDKWKVITPFANNIGTNLPDDNLNTIIAEPNSIVTETYLVIGADLNLNEHTSANIGKYLKTKFVRFLISIAKANQNGTKKTYRFVPIQNFTDGSDIDWKKSVNEIDEELFNKYKMSVEEREYIKSSIKDM